MQDFLAMAALQYVIKLLELENQHDDKPVADAIDGLTQKLESILSEGI